MLNFNISKVAYCLMCLIKHVLTVCPLTSTLACLVTKQCLMMFGRQTSFVTVEANLKLIHPNLARGLG